MNPPAKPSSSQTSLFQVYLRLRPPITKEEAAHAHRGERYLNVEPAEAPEDHDVLQSQHPCPTHITLQPPNDSRKRAVEKFAFTRVFEEDSKQLEVFENTGMPALIQGVLKEGRDALVATLGVTGSGKSHTILGSKNQRGLTQMSLDVLFRSLSDTVRSADNFEDPTLLPSLSAADFSESQMFSARNFIDSIYSDPSDRGRASRAQTPMSRGQTPLLESTSTPLIPRRHLNQRLSALPTLPDVTHLITPVDSQAEHAVVVSMYEVYNDRIFDLLSPTLVPGPGGVMTRQGGNSQKDRRRPLLFKSTEGSPDRKVVAGLRKVVCSTYEEAMMVLETGLNERRIAGTGSNNVSSRSHGFFCLEVKKKVRGRRYGEVTWTGNTLTVVDLAGSERARNAKTAGATLAEAGKINESLMYLGQCLQMQSDFSEGNKTVVPYRQCKLTELLFSNSFPSSHTASHNRYPQKAIMIATADPLGDFNATSQILRYSALAREVTVPRIPSVTSTILSSSSSTQSRPPTANGRTTPYAASTEDLEEAAREIVRITDDYEALIIKLAEEEIARQEVELKLRATEERCIMIEQEVREECWAEMEDKMDEERKRWQDAMDRQAGRHEEHLDNKLELATRGIQIYEDPEPTRDERVEELERENDFLRSRLAALERQLNVQSSPTRKPKSRTTAIRDSHLDYDSSILSNESSDLENMFQKVNTFKVTESYSSLSKPKASMASNIKKPRRVTARKKDLGPEEDL